VQRFRIGRAEQPRLAEVHDLDAAGRAEVENRHRGESLRPQAEHVESETHRRHASDYREWLSAGPLVRWSAGALVRWSAGALVRWCATGPADSGPADQRI